MVGKGEKEMAGGGGMSYGLIIITLLFCLGGCRSAESRAKGSASRQVYVTGGIGEECSTSQRRENEFKHAFGEFYKDGEGR
jgi:hypothetical protein